MTTKTTAAATLFQQFNLSIYRHEQRVATANLGATDNNWELTVNEYYYINTELRKR